MTRKNPTLVIRSFNFSDEDYVAGVNIRNACTPDQLDSVNTWKANDESRDKKYLRKNIVAELDGKIVGLGTYGHSEWTHQPGKYFFHCAVYPDCRGQGVGSTLFNFILNELDKRGDFKLLTSRTREDQPEAIQFLEKREFIPNSRNPISRLDVAGFDDARFAEIFKRLEEANVQLMNVADLQKSDPNCWRKIYELDWIITQDVPSPYPFTKPDYTTYVNQTFDPTLGHHPEGFIVAIAPSDNDAHGDYIGISALSTNEANPTKLYTDVTGVLGSHRRMGIATAMKVRAIQFAKNYGATEIETENEENNPMFDLNVALGFREVTAYLDYKKEIHSPNE